MSKTKELKKESTEAVVKTMQKELNPPEYKEMDFTPKNEHYLAQTIQIDPKVALKVTQDDSPDVVNEKLLSMYDQHFARAKVVIKGSETGNTMQYKKGDVVLLDTTIPTKRIILNKQIYALISEANILGKVSDVE